MPDAEQIETVDAEPVLALDTPLAGFPAELPAHLADELAELLKDAERYAAAAQDAAAGAPGSENNPPLDRLPRMEARLGALSNTFR